MSERPSPIVIKLGGSVLTGKRAYARAAAWLADRVFGPPLLVVVSAEQGTTDRLLDEARSISAHPDARARDLLWATGELRSAALLALHLQARGVPACALNVHETGLRPDPGGLHVRASDILKALESHAIVVVPGFLGSTDRGTIVSLGRGGSDLSAVTLAAALGAGHCELIKDVPGYFTADPATRGDARHLPQVDFDTAIDMAAAGCDLVQPAALETARAHNVRLLVTTTRAGDRRTIVSGGDPCTPPGLVARGAPTPRSAPRRSATKGDSPDAICHEDDSCRAAVGA